MQNEQIEQFVLSDLVKNASIKNIPDEENLIDSGVLDSLGIVKLVAFLENTFNLKVSDDEILIENFESISAISKFISGKKGK